MADKYFPEGNALGKTLILDNQTAVKVTAIYQDMPTTGHFRFDMLISMTAFEEAESTPFPQQQFQYLYLVERGSRCKSA